MRTLCCLSLLLAACSFSGDGSQGTSDASSTDGGDPADGGADACADQCTGDTLVSCTEAAPVTCPLGCNAAGTGCTAIVPSNNAGNHSIDPSMVLPWLLDQNATINTDTGEVTSLGLGQRLPGPGVISGIGYEQLDGHAIFVVSSMRVETGVAVNAVGSLPLIVISLHDVEVRGRIDVSAAQNDCGLNEMISCPGPGGGDGADTNQAAGGCAAGENGNAAGGVGGESGGGGAGGRDVGAPGGDGNSGTNGGAGGTPATPECVDETIVPLTGGSGGGRGGDEQNTHAGGGGGGGAVQISSNTHIRFIGALDVPAGVLASGAGGAGGGGSDGGGGGGSGGSILLEAPTVTLEETTLAANGGSGGGCDDGDDGVSGTFDDVPAPGANGGNGGDGGDGGTVIAPVAGGGGNDGGGGGGAAGRIRINTNMLNEVGTLVRSPPETTSTVTAAD